MLPLHTKRKTIKKMSEPNNIIIDSRFVPQGYIYCYLSQCPRHEECLRWIASQQVEPDKLTSLCVMPKAMNQNPCPLYQKPEVQRMAFGFKKLFYDVKSRDETPLRDRIKAYLRGNSNYYRYNNGTRMLSPKQQEHIIDIFRKAGYEGELSFETYINTYDFDH